MFYRVFHWNFLRLPLALMASVALLASCATSHSPDTAQSSSPSDSTASSASLPDPRTLTGLSVMESLGDPTPISGTFTPRLPASITDVQGNAVTVTDTSRILPLDLTGNISRTLIALGLTDSIVGRTVSSTETALEKLPVVTENGHSINVEAALALHPTLVLTDLSVGPVEAFDHMRASGIPVVVLDSKHSLSTVEASIQAIGDAVGMGEAAQALGKRTRAEVDKAQAQIAQWAPKNPLNIAFLYVRGTAGVFFILGSEEGTSSLIEGVGAKDIATANGITSTTPASAEALLKVNPDVYFTMSGGLESTGGLDGLLSHPGVSDTSAGQKQRVIAIPDGMSLSFGPQTGEVLLAVARALYGVQE